MLSVGHQQKEKSLISTENEMSYSWPDNRQ